MSRFVCPACGDGSMLGVHRVQIICYDVPTWNEDGTPREFGDVCDRWETPDDPPHHQRYICGACCCEFSEPRKVEDTCKP